MALRLLNQISNRYVTNTIRCASTGRKMRTAPSPPHFNRAGKEEVANHATVTATSRRTHSQPACEREFFQHRIPTDANTGDYTQFQPKVKLKSKRERKRRTEAKDETDSVELVRETRHKKSLHNHNHGGGRHHHQSDLSTLDLLDSSKLERKKKGVENCIKARRYSTSMDISLDKGDEEAGGATRKIEKNRRQYLSLDVHNNSSNNVQGLVKINAPWKSYSESMKSNRARKAQNIYYPNASVREQYSPRRDYSSQTIDPRKLVKIEDVNTKKWADDWQRGNQSAVGDLVTQCKAYDFEKFKDTLLKGARECGDKFTGILDPNPAPQQNLRTYTSQCQSVQGPALKNPPLKRLVKRYDRIQGRTRSYNLTEVETTPRADDNIDVHKLKPLPVLKQQKFLPGMMKDFNTAYYPHSGKDLKPLRTKYRYF